MFCLYNFSLKCTIKKRYFPHNDPLNWLFRGGFVFKMCSDSRIRRSSVLDELTKTLKLVEFTLTSHTFAWSLIAEWEEQAR